jgi:hypothetical protein
MAEPVGCLRRLGCLVLLLLCAAGAWITRDRWRPFIPARVQRWIAGGAPAGLPADSTQNTSTWRPVTAAGASHAEHMMVALADKSGPAYTMLAPADFGAFVLTDVAGHVPPPNDSTEAAIIDHRFALRTSLDIKALGGRTAFGPIGGMLADREPMTLAGTVDVVRQGVAEFRVQQLTVHGISVPSWFIPDLVHKVEIGQHPAGLAPDALLLNIPPYVSDIRIVGSRVAMYRTVP